MSDSGRILIVGLGNPGSRYAKTRHNIGYEIVAELSRRWDTPKAKERFKGLISDGRAWPGGPQVTLLLPQTYMNESGRCAGPARGSLKVELDHVVAIYDEIDLGFAEVKTRIGGGHAGNNGVRSLIEGFGSPEFWRVRVGVSRPDSTEPEVVSAWVLGRFSEPESDVQSLISTAADQVEALIRQIHEQDQTD